MVLGQCTGCKRLLLLLFPCCHGIELRALGSLECLCPSRDRNCSHVHLHTVVRPLKNYETLVEVRLDFQCIFQKFLYL